uniref:Uncharacterized protein n=1 Tax=viral metagenome TaxID=1070528 RepID=A0A2V0RJK0_9ZZZZ
MFPLSELSTIRSLTETEGKSSTDVVDSKFSSNYGTILRITMGLLRFSESDKLAIKYMNMMCDLVGVDPSRIPVHINKDINEVDVIQKKFDVPKGLLSERSTLEQMSLPYKLIGTDNLYELLFAM